MRIQEIGLRRVGAHQDRLLTGLHPGLNVIYGPNEWGKSTLLMALRGVLFGRPNMAELGPILDKEAEAWIVAASDVDPLPVTVRRQLARRTAPRLMAANGTVRQGQSVLVGEFPELAKVEDVVYQSVFSFQLAELRDFAEGGRALQQRVYAFELLAGLAPVDVEARLSDAARSLYNPDPRAKNPRLLQQLREMRSLEEAARARRDTPEAYLATQQDLRLAQARLEERKGDLDKARAKLDSCRRDQVLWPIWQEHSEVDRKIRALEGTFDSTADLLLELLTQAESVVARGGVLERECRRLWAQLPSTSSLEQQVRDGRAQLFQFSDGETLAEKSLSRVDCEWLRTMSADWLALQRELTQAKLKSAAAVEDLDRRWQSCASVAARVGADGSTRDLHAAREQVNVLLRTAHQDRSRLEDAMSATDKLVESEPMVRARQEEYTRAANVAGKSGPRLFVGWGWIPWLCLGAAVVALFLKQWWAAVAMLGLAAVGWWLSRISSGMLARRVQVERMQNSIERELLEWKAQRETWRDLAMLDAEEEPSVPSANLYKEHRAVLRERLERLQAHIDLLHHLDGRLDDIENTMSEVQRCQDLVTHAQTACASLDDTYRQWLIARNLDEFSEDPGALWVEWERGSQVAREVTIWEQQAAAIANLFKQLAADLANMESVLSMSEPGGRLESAAVRDWPKDDQILRSGVDGLRVDEASLVSLELRGKTILAHAAGLAQQLRELREWMAEKRELGVRAVGAAGSPEVWEQTVARFREADTAAIHQAVAAAESNFSTIQAEVETCIRRHADLEQSLRTWEDGPSAESQQWALASVQAAVKETAWAWAAAAIAEQLVRETRERVEREHQPAVLRTASRLFARLTSGKYVLLTAHTGKGGHPELIAMDADGSRWEVNHLSRGAREAIYFALRLAVLEDYGVQGISLPVVMDDPLVNMDRDRLHVCLEVLCEAAQHHQILFLTCHTEIREVLSQMPDAHMVTVGSGGDC